MGFSVRAGTYWALGCLYLVLVAYCVRHYVRVYTTKQKESPRRTTAAKNQQKKSWAPFFYPMLMVGCAIRGTYMLSEAGGFIGYKNVVLLLNTVPTLVLFSAYMIVLLSWAQLYHAADKVTALRLVYFFTNFLFYCGYAVIYGLGIFSGTNLLQQDNIYHKALWYMCGLMYFLCSIAFLVYALLLVKFLRVALFATKFDTIKQINYFTFLVVLVSLLRCGVVILEGIEKLPRTDTSDEENIWWVVEPVYFALLEVLPLIIMIQIFQMHRAKQAQTVVPSQTTPLLSPSPPTPKITIPPLPTSETPISPFLFNHSPPRIPKGYYV